MKIEQFIAQSAGQWNSMRSGHSLAFQQFEQVISIITIKILRINDNDVVNLLNSNHELDSNQESNIDSIIETTSKIRNIEIEGEIKHKKKFENTLIIAKAGKPKLK